MRVALTAAVLFSGLTAIQVAPALAAPAQDPSGTWLTGDGRAKVRIDRCGPAGANICGKVVWLKSPTTEDGTPRTDIKNPDPKKRSRPALGLTLLDNLPLPSRLFIYARFPNMSACGFIEIFFNPSGA